MSSEHPVDEFDNPPADGPVGAHRRPVSRWQPVLPFLAVLVVVPLLAWGVSEFMMRDAGRTSTVEEVVEEPSQSGEAPPAEQSGPQSAIDGESPLPPIETEPQSEEPPADESVDFGAGIEVLNVAGIDGLGANTVARLNEAGFTNARADNMYWDVAVNTIYYQSAEMEPTARKVAETLGITEVYLDEVIAQPDPIVVFLVTP